VSPRAGLQCERTWLAWKRTVLSQAACAALLLKASAESGWGLAALPAVLAACAACVTYAVALRTDHRLRAAGAPRAVPIGLLAVVAAATAATAVSAAVLWL
jgi:uncharacterized membrane protein YidH (DUF202 family)